MRVLLIIAITLLLLGCGNNSGVKTEGLVGARVSGSIVTLPKKQKLVLVTWKKDGMWLLYRPFRAGEYAEEYKYQNETGWGFIEPTITIKESE